METTHKYSLKIEAGKERVRVKEVLKSPCCGMDMRCHHLRKRSYTDGEKRVLIIEVHSCPGCGKQHSIIPDFLKPYKRYTVKTICEIVKSPPNGSVAVPNTRVRLIKWLLAFLEFLSKERPEYRNISFASYTAEQLNAVLQSIPSEVELAFRMKIGKA